MMSNNHYRTLIVSGGRLGAWALEEIKPDDILIGADRGALFLIEHGYRPSLAIGDFDSVTSEEKGLIQQHSDQFLSCDALMKDEPDTEQAFLHAVGMQPSEIVLIGAV